MTLGGLAVDDEGEFVAGDDLDLDGRCCLEADAVVVAG